MRVLLTFRDGHSELVEVDVRINLDRFIIHVMKNCGVTSYQLI